MSRTGVTSLHTVRQGAGADVAVGLGHFVLDGDTLKIASEGPADAQLMLIANTLHLIDDEPTGDAYLLRFGNSVRVRDR